MSIQRIGVNNIAKYYDDPNGNLYFRVLEDEESDYELMDGFSLDELRAALDYGDIEMIYVPGTAQAIIENLLVEEIVEKIFNTRYVIWFESKVCDDNVGYFYRNRKVGFTSSHSPERAQRFKTLEGAEKRLADLVSREGEYYNFKIKVVS